MSKKDLFEYFLRELVDWYCEYYKTSVSYFNEHSFNDLSKLKVLKLHFFACSTEEEALNIFNEFHAMPYGHVESDVYSYLNTLKYFNVTNSKLEFVNINDWNIVPDGDSEVIDRAIKNLKGENAKLISFSPFELVELSHSWFSWRYTFSQARKKESFSKKIATNLIQQETKIYSL
ncbi:hypothetical protein [Albibacterium bauzanense]|uniref:Uncharacterized protein n=1 Tax=Albibacterium bauzanense TaxID=653929 RepID=A0A4R1LZW2_9SPHI|nr:hypothetical protein [Albibacterium bauzanense]TCK82913.1 hypothetical protein C8N28_1500 [Albibacterium bauzanense]